MFYGQQTVYVDVIYWYNSYTYNLIDWIVKYSLINCVYSIYFKYLLSFGIFQSKFKNIKYN